MTRDALTAEGFSAAGANVGMVNNWFVDYYTNPDDNPYSGHAHALVGLLRFGFNREDWLFQWVEGAQRMHFDAGIRQVGMPDLSNTAGVEQGMATPDVPHAQVGPVRRTAEPPDPLEVMAVLGISLHAVQDFYTHSNWVEDPHPENGRGGPGIASLGYGETPTWFDVPPEVRRSSGQSRGLHRGEGHPARARQLAVEQEQAPQGRPQQGLAGPSEVPGVVRDGVLRHAAVDPRGPDLAGQRAAVEARAVAAHTRRRSGTTSPAPRRSRSSAGTGRAEASRASRSSAGSAPATRAASRACASRSATSMTAGPLPTGGRSTGTSGHSASTRPARSACRTCPRAGRIRCSRAS